PGLGKRLAFRERPVRQYQVGVARRDVAETVPAGRAVAVGNAPFRHKTVVVGRADLEFANAICRQGDAADGHGSFLSAEAVGLDAGRGCRPPIPARQSISRSRPRTSPTVPTTRRTARSGPAT